MLVRMCPYCDHEMTKRHHCDFCNSFVWKAETMDIHFNSESRGKNETDCAYGTEHDQVHHHGAEKRGSTARGGDQAGQARGGQTSQTRGGQTGKAGGSALKLIGVILAAVVIFLAPQIGSFITVIVDRVSEMNSSQELPVNVSDSVTSDVEYLELTEADIAGKTVHCNGSSHMELTGEDIFSMSERFLEDNYHGEIYGTRKQFQGYEMKDGTGKVLYENAYFIELDKALSEYIAVYADAVTDEIHSITIQMKDKSYIRGFLVLLLKDKAGISALTDQDLDMIFEVDDYGFFAGECGNYEVLNHYRESDSIYSVSVHYSSFPWSNSVLKNEQEISREQMMAGGRECTVRDHFRTELDDTAAIGLINQWLTEYGYGSLSMEAYEINRLLTYEQLADIEYEAAEFHREYYWSSDSAAPTVSLYSDSYSGRIHSLAFDGIDQDAVPALMELVTSIIGFGDAGDFAEQCLRDYTADGYAFLYTEGYEIYLSGSDDRLYLTVSPYEAR